MGLTGATWDDLLKRVYGVSHMGWAVPEILTAVSADLQPTGQTGWTTTGHSFSRSIDPHPS